MKRDNKWYLKEIIKLRTIIESDSDIESMISREYLHEKLNLIVTGQGINLHPILKTVADKKFKEIYGD